MRSSKIDDRKRLAAAVKKTGKSKRSHKNPKSKNNKNTRCKRKEAGVFFSFFPSEAKSWGREDRVFYTFGTRKGKLVPVFRRGFFYLLGMRDGDLRGKRLQGLSFGGYGVDKQGSTNR